MDIWVRSQSKSAIANVHYMAFSEDLYRARTTYPPAYNIVCDNGVILGAYATKERCIEIINDFENCLHNLLLRENQTADKVMIYQMPKE